MVICMALQFSITYNAATYQTHITPRVNLNSDVDGPTAPIIVLPLCNKSFHASLTHSVLGHMAAIVLRPFSGNFTHDVKNSEEGNYVVNLYQCSWTLELYPVPPSVCKELTT
jgi:hypothetical protein